MGSQYKHCAVSMVVNDVRESNLGSTVAVASERVKRPSDHASSDIFNIDLRIWSKSSWVTRNP